MPCGNGMCGVLIPTYFPSYRLKFYMKSTQIRAWYRSNFQPLRWVCSSVPSSSDFNCFKKSKSFYNGNLSLECGVHWVDMYILLLFSFFPLLQNPLNSIRLRSLNAFHGTKNSPFPLFPYLMRSICFPVASTLDFDNNPAMGIATSVSSYLNAYFRHVTQ